VEDAIARHFCRVFQRDATTAVTAIA
jgi:hypothetical protein